jgi:hypothetical protein
MLQLDIQILTVPTSPLQRRVWDWKLIRRLVLEAATTLSTISSRRHRPGELTTCDYRTGNLSVWVGPLNGDSQFYGNIQEWVVGGGRPLGTYNPEAV